MSFFSGMNAEVFKWSGIAMLAVGLFCGAWVFLSSPQSILRRYWLRYLAHLDQKLRSMFIFTPPKHIAFAQLAAVLFVLLAYLTFELPLWYVWLGLIAAAPYLLIERKRRKRVELIEAQIDGFLVGLANALKSTPSIASAIVSVQAILQAPLRDEVELALKEMRVGSSLEQSLLNMGGRVGSRQLDSALSAVLIGRQVGGNLSEVLETTATTLREMSRLEGVVRSKTADGKVQLVVMAAVPFVLIATLNAIENGYFTPLTTSIIGNAVALVAGASWLASLLVARKILWVDL